MDSTFAAKNKKMLKNIGYKSLFARSSEEAISLLEMNDEIKLAIIDIDTVEDVFSLVSHIKSKIFIPVIYTTVDKKIPINLYNDFYHSCLPKDSSEFLLETLLGAALKLFSGIRDCKIKCSVNKNNENLERGEQYRAIFENDQVIMMIINPETKKIVDVNFAATKFYGWSREEMTKMSLSDISLINGELLEKKFNLVKSQKKNYFTVKNKIRNGDIIDIEVYSGPIKIDGENLVFEIIKDVTHRKEFENMIKKLAYYDALTDLPNRKSFSTQLTESIKKSEINNSKIVLINLDIDYFKDVNDSFGQHVGDSLLVEVARRLEKSIRESNQVYRKGGDEFAIIINETLSQNEVSKICDRLLSQLKKPVNIEGHQIFVTGSIGVSIYPEDGTDSETLLKNSDLAMYKSKEKGKNTYHFFSEKIDLEKKLKRDVASNLRQALLKKELQLYFQPKIDLQKSEIMGSECLVRWIKDGKLYKSPGEFIPVAETSGLILDLDKYVLSEACRQIETWEKSNMKGQKVSVNISGVHFKQKRIIDTANSVLKRFKIPKGAVELEITEGIFLEDIEEAADTLIELKTLGFEISIDDFGTGYSSFKYLSRLPINRIKIDKSFIENINDIENDIAITKMIISMGKLLNLNVIAEGVETKEQMNLLIENGCTEVQGYYFGKPMPLKEYEKFYRINKDKIDVLYFQKLFKIG